MASGGLQVESHPEYVTVLRITFSYQFRLSLPFTPPHCFLSVLLSVPLNISWPLDYQNFNWFTHPFSSSPSASICPISVSFIWFLQRGIWLAHLTLLLPNHGMGRYWRPSCAPGPISYAGSGWGLPDVKYGHHRLSFSAGALNEMFLLVEGSG